MTILENAPLGNLIAYEYCYDPTILYPIPRSLGRGPLNINNTSPFVGVDLWGFYELSWLNNQGKPQIATGYFTVPHDSPNIIEAKSIKLYLNGFHMYRATCWDDISHIIIADLSKVAGATVNFVLHAIEDTLPTQNNPPGTCLDNLPITDPLFGPNKETLQLEDSLTVVEEELFSHLLKSNCLKTRQPDWGTLYIKYKGQRINHRNLLEYIISYRTYVGFMEQCVESMFVDIMERCKPEELTVYALYTRRGGLDTNPFRSTHQEKAPLWRLSRQ